MNQILFVTLLAFVGLFPAKMMAQSEANLRFGGQVSPSMSWISSDKPKVLGGGPNLGLKVGAIGEFGFAENYFIAVGLGFGFNQGGKLTFADGGDLLPKSELSNEIPEHLRNNFPTDTKIDYKLNYLEIPVSLKLRTREYGFVRYYAELPIITLGAVTAAKGNIDAANLDVNKENIKKDVKRLNAQWGLGGGLEYNFSQTNALVFGAYYHQGFFDITKKNGNNDDRAVNHNVTVRVGVLF